MFTKYKNGAEVEIEEVYRFSNGAEQEADGVYRVKNGAEEQVWANTRVLPLLDRTTTTGCFFANEGDWDNSSWLWAVDDGGYIILAVDGNFANPTIGFTYSGGLNFTPSDGVPRTAPAGNIYTYGVKSDGTVEESNSQEVGSASGFSDDTPVEFTLSGTYTRIGIKVKFHNWNISPDHTGSPCACIVFLGSIKLNGDKYVTSKADNYNYNDY